MKFPDLIHAAKPEPNNAIPQAATAPDTFWDFASLMTPAGLSGSGGCPAGGTHLN